MLNNFTLFKVEVKEGLNLQWYGEAGLGLAYTTRAHSPEERSPQKQQLGLSKRAATLMELTHKRNVQLP